MLWRDGPRLGVWEMVTLMTFGFEPQEMVPVNRASAAIDMSALAEELVASAVERGVERMGNYGLLTALTRLVLQAAL